MFPTETIGLSWNIEDTQFYPMGTLAYAGDLCFVIKRSKTQTPKWRVYLEICTHKEFGVKDDIKRGVLVAEYPGTLTLESVHLKVEEYLLVFVGRILQDIA